MSDLIQLLGSIVIAAYVILIILALNLRINESATQYYQDTFNQRSVIGAANILDYDFHKIGYKASSAKIVQADSSSIKYASDYDNTGTMDTISYYLSSTSAMSSTKNPRDKLLYRKVNQTVNTASVVTRFYIQYYDSLLNKLSYSSLTNPTNRANIRTIRVLVKGELADSISTHYSPVEWRKEYRPRNLK
jgi:hypothetical protein